MKRKFKLLILLCMIIICSGCTKQLKDGKTLVTNEATGQTLTSNILCQPSDKELYELYNKYDKKLQVSLKKLPKCNAFTPNKIEYKSLWESLFVKPLAFLLLKLGYWLKDMGLSVMILGLLIRILMMPLQIKSLKQAEITKKIQPEMQKIENKYKDKNDQESLMAKSQETMMLYKKYNINPISGCLLSLIQLPIFFAFLEAINRVPAIFEGRFLKTSLYLGMTPSTGIAQHKYIYIVLIILIILSTFIAFKNSLSSQDQNSEMAKQTKYIMIFMIITISIASLSLPTAIGLYWIVTNGFALVQNFIIKKIIGKKSI